MTAITLPPIPGEPTARDLRIIPAARYPRRLYFTGSGLSSAAVGRVCRVLGVAVIYRRNSPDGVDFSVELPASRKAEVLAALNAGQSPERV